MINSDTQSGRWINLLSVQSILKAIVPLGSSDLKEDNFATDERGTSHPDALALVYCRPGRCFTRQSQWLNLESESDAEVDFLFGPDGNIDDVVREPLGKLVANVV